MPVEKRALISLLEVTKWFRTGVLKRKLAVDNLTLEVPEGEVVGLLGPNGSGKSTTIKMILGLLRPTTGDIFVDGIGSAERAARTRIGYLPENPRFQRFLTGSQILRYYGRLLGLPGRELAARQVELLELVGLKSAGEERVQGYSKGMTQRLAIAQSLLNRPRLLIFDEPMSGLDPVGRMEIRKLIRDIRGELRDTTIFFSTHILTDVEELCSQVALLNRGRLQARRPLAELLSAETERYDLVVASLPPEFLNRLSVKFSPKPTAGGTLLDVEGAQSLAQVLADVNQAGAKVISVTTQRPSLERALFSEAGARG